MKYIVLLQLFLTCATAFCQKHNYASITTPYGGCIIKLYNETPAHRDNFIAYAKKKYYDQTFFHRVIQDFVIQGGDPDSFFVAPQQGFYTYGDKRLSAEFHPACYHKRGALGMGRDENPEKGSFFTQIYIVQGKRWTLDELTAIEKKYKIQFTDEQKNTYTTMGGLPRLDQSYVVFGEVIAGMDMVDRIAALPTNEQDVPKKPVRMKIRALSEKRAFRKLKRL